MYDPARYGPACQVSEIVAKHIDSKIDAADLEICATSSEGQFEAELKIPRRVHLGVDHTRGGRADGGVRQPELRAVERIERLKPELHVNPLFNRKILSQSEIEVRQRLGAQPAGKAGDVAIGVRRGNGECRDIEESIEPVLHAGRGAEIAAYLVGTLRASVVAERVRRGAEG